MRITNIFILLIWIKSVLKLSSLQSLKLGTLLTEMRDVITLSYINNLLLDKYVAYDRDLFYVANSQQIKVLKIEASDFDLDSDDQRIIEPEQEKISVIVPEETIHGFFVYETEAMGRVFRRFLIALETKDN